MVRQLVVHTLYVLLFIFQRLKKFRCIEAINDAVARKSYSTGKKYRMHLFVDRGFSPLFISPIQET